MRSLVTSKNINWPLCVALPMALYKYVYDYDYDLIWPTLYMLLAAGALCLPDKLRPVNVRQNGHDSCRWRGKFSSIFNGRVK